MGLSEFREIFDLISDGIALLDGDLHHVSVNAEYCRFWELERESVVGSTSTGILDNAIREKMLRCLGDEDVNFEQWVDSPAMGRRYVDVRCTPHRDEKEDVAGVLVVLHDITDRKNTEDETQAERDKLDTILSSVDAGLILFDRDMKILWANKALLRSYPDGDPRGVLCRKFFQRSDDFCTGCPVMKTMEDGLPHHREVYIESLDQWHSFSTAPIFDEDGNLVQVLGQDMDVTTQRRSLDALEAREAELAGILRSSQVGIGAVRDRVFIQANEFFFHMLGYERDEVIGHTTSIAYSSMEEFERVGESIYKALVGEAVATEEAQWVRKDGSLLDVLITVTSIDPESSDAWVSFVVMDITEHKRAQAALLESERRFRRIFEEVEVIAVQGYDHARRVVYWNPASERLYGYTREEAKGRLLEDLIIPESIRDKVVEGHHAWLEKGEVIPPGELELVRKDGTMVPIYSSHVLQETARGEKIMYCVDVDLTEIKRIHNELVRAKEEAEAANRAKSEFLANMSHEIRTPLNGIQGMLSLLLRSGLEGEQRNYAEAGVESAVRLNRLLSDVLDISRIEAGGMAVHEEPFNLPELVDHVCELFRLAFVEAGVVLKRHVDENVPHWVIGDGIRLQQILTNLVGNGLKYTDKGEVRVEVSRLTPLVDGQERIFISIADTGIGISRDVLASLFEPFIQGSRGYARQYQGAGLGLSICKRLVDLMGGHMAVESVPNEGSSFHVVLPFKADNQDREVPTAVEHDEDKLPTLSVLLAEDDKVNRLVGVRLLEGAGCDVTVALNGHEVLARLREKPFDAVFMDIQMPGMDGVEATKAIRKGEAGEDQRDVPIYAMTAYTMAGDRQRLLDQGMDGYISKPVEVDHIQAVLEEVAGNLRRES